MCVVLVHRNIFFKLTANRIKTNNLFYTLLKLTVKCYQGSFVTSVVNSKLKTNKKKQFICLYTFRKDPLQLNSCSHDQSRFPAKIEFGVFKRRTSEIRNGDDNRCDPKHRNRRRTFSRLFLWKHRCLQSLLSLVL